ncbi:MAG: hypothetical protein QE273_18605 [Verrucomicrobiales bacterium]|nr:hypothetical protein [Verrucomicrobiales bacterium]
MKSSPSLHDRGAALILTLVLVAVIALVVVSLFALTRQETTLSGAVSASVRARLGEEAAFAEASAKLGALTANDAYLVTLGRQGSGTAGPTRYTFVSTLAADGITHHPLFAGGEEHRAALPDFDGADTASLVDAAIAVATVSFAGEPRADAIRLPRLSGLDASGNLVAENPRPEVGFIELPSDAASPWRTRYTYWIEDLEGYPNLDVIGTQGAPHPDAAIRPGYAAHDHRVRSTPAAFAMERATEKTYHFPLAHRGQSLVDQVAPGLSPREIVLQSWPIAGGVHPYRDASHLLRERHHFSGSHHDFVGEPNREPTRFASGLQPYRTVPHIPHGHGYVDEGKPRFNLNTLVASRDVGIADLVSRNLPAFADRRGGFPNDEDYLATLAANAIDYTDEDSRPALPRNTINAGARVFRGVDTYCPVNEFFLKFTYVGYERAGARDLLVFEATPYVEFWNPSNREAKMETMRLRFRFLERIRFRANSVWHEIHESHRVLDEAFPANGGLAVTVPPNHYEVVSFGRIRWKVSVPRPPLVAFPLVQDLRGVANVSVRAHYELYLGNDRIDQCGRPEPNEDPNAPTYGFFFPRHQPVLAGGEFFLRLATPSLAGKSFGFNAGFGAHLGDPWMPWYSRATAEDAQYRLKATPAFRNFDHDKVTTAQPDRFKDQSRVRDWPDRGYDTGLAPSTNPNSDTELPDSFNRPTTAAEAAFAPWRINNQGRFFSVTELGNLYDPVMWIPGPASGPDSLVAKQTTQRFSLLRDAHLKSLPMEAQPGKMWGGGNTLRIGRPEHERFDQPGRRASQWLDLFHVGYNGTNLGPAPGTGTSVADLYRHHDPRDHQPPPTASDPVESQTEPYAILYDPELNAQGRYTLVYGHLNLNTAPTRFEIETLLRGPFVSCDLRLERDDHKTPDYLRDGEGGPLRSGLREDAIPLIAEGILAARPFYSPSHFARVLSGLIDRHDALPDHHNDAEAEETFARIFNTTTLSSRHFRIHSAAEVYHGTTGEVVGRAGRVRELFVRPEREANGTIIRTRLEILSTREP